MVGLVQEDKEWKDLLRGNLANHGKALDWWLDFKVFTDCGWVPGRKKRLLEECGIDSM